MRLLQKGLSSVLAALIVMVSGPWLALAQQGTSSIVGGVLNTQKNPVPGIKILAEDPSGKILGEAVTNAEGNYNLANLSLGQYQLTLDPLKFPFQGETVVASLGPQGLTVDWIVSENAKAIALATPGIEPAGPFALGATSRAIIAGVIVSGGLGSMIWAITTISSSK